ncbi:MAG: transposase [Firmicutes bacterium]|nr:transposase [Bacillota bacterium]
MAALELIENLTERAWAEIEDKIMYALKTFIEELLEEELTQRLGADRYERTEERMGYRGGHYRRGLTTRFGHIGDLRMPRPAQGPAPFTLFERYERRRWDVDAGIGRLFLLGVSTRKIKGVVKDITGIPVSGKTVSRITACLEEEP